MNPITKKWLIVHVAYPLTPFLLEGVIRLAVFNFALKLDTFNASRLAMSMALLCLFTIQSISNKENTTPNNTEPDRKTAIHLFIIYTIFSIAFFCAVILCKAITDHYKYDLQILIDTLSIFIFCGTIFPLISAYNAQKSFKLIN